MGVHGYPGHLNADDVLSEVYRDGPGDVLAYAVKSSRTGWAQQIYVAYRSAGGGRGPAPRGWVYLGAPPLPGNGGGGGAPEVKRVRVSKRAVREGEGEQP